MFTQIPIQTQFASGRHRLQNQPACMSCFLNPATRDRLNLRDLSQSSNSATHAVRPAQFTVDCNDAITPQCSTRLRRRFSNLTKLRSMRAARQQHLLQADPAQVVAQTSVQSSALSSNRAADPGAPFDSSPFPQLKGGVFDLGVVDVNNDDIFDIFTVRHNATENLLLGNAAGQFTDVLTLWGLEQDRQFPGLNDFDVVPPATPGLNIYRQQDRQLHLDFHQALGRKPVTGEIVVPSPKGTQKPSVVVMNRHRARVKVQDHP